ncbi:MAG: hypothetical protein HY897_18200 [Deltaproteobacteria bacterium]|nr:hypothetical protein [Deltaproteobacteria bacterium]
MTRLALLAVFALVLHACAGGTGSEADQDGGGGTDAGSADAGGSDAGGSIEDAGTDAGPAKPATTDYFIVHGDGLGEAAAQYAAYREETGFKTEVHALSDLVADPTSASELAGVLHTVLAEAREKLDEKRELFLLVLGDAPATGGTTDGTIPAAVCESNLGECVTDNVYADLDGDALPDLAVGRVPAATAEDALSYLQKLRTHESTYKTGLWNRRIALYTGQGGFGDEIDSFIEYMVMKALSEMNHSFDVIGAYDNPNSPYYYMPFESKVVDLFNDGSILTVYIGHGYSEGMTGLSVEQLGQIHCSTRLPVALFFACSTGEYANPEVSIAEAIVLKPDGAVASMGASGISHPYGNAVLSYEMQRAAMNSKPDTVGEVILKMKRQSMEHTDEFREIVDEFAVTSGVPKEEQELTRRQHVDLYNLFGDPAAAMNYPRRNCDLTPGAGGSMASGKVTVSAKTTGFASGKAYVTLEANRDKIIHEPAPVDPDNPDEKTVQENWKKAVDKVVVGKEVAVSGGVFETDLEVPAGLPEGKYFIKVYADDGATDCYGSTEAP